MVAERPPGHEPGQLVLKCPLRLRPAAEPTHLQPRRTAACDAIPVGPQRLPIHALRLQLEHLTLLDHLGTSSIDNEIEESHLRRDHDDPATEKWSASDCDDRYRHKTSIHQVLRARGGGRPVSDLSLSATSC